MGYSFNSAAFSSVFTLPVEIVDKHIKLANENQIKVILYLFRNFASGISPENTAEALGLPESEVKDALLYWVQSGVILSDSESVPENNEKDTTVRKAQKPSREDVAHRGNDDPKIMLLLREAQLKFGRNLKTNETVTLVWLYEDLGMDVSVILLLLQYAAGIGKANISFIEKTAVKWIDSGVESVTDAEQAILRQTRDDLSWSMISKAFGIEKRKPTKKETEFARLWVEERRTSRELLECAYDTCINSTGKISFPYMDKVLASWYEKGIKTREQAEQAGASFDKHKKNDFAAYDLDLFEKMINSDDQ